MLLQVRDALEKQNFVSQGDVIEQDRMLVDLAHVAYVSMSISCSSRRCALTL